MLERPTLLLRPWLDDGSPGGERVWVLDPVTQDWVGSACRATGRGVVARLRRWAWPRIAIREADDEPLLCTLARGWTGRAWRVWDADGHPVGRVHGPRLIDRRGQPAAVLRRGPGDDAGVYEGPRGRDLAVTEAAAEGVRLTFLPPGRDDPFVQMVLLAAALVHSAARLAACPAAAAV